MVFFDPLERYFITGVSMGMVSPVMMPEIAHYPGD